MTEMYSLHVNKIQILRCQEHVASTTYLLDSIAQQWLNDELERRNGLDLIHEEEKYRKLLMMVSYQLLLYGFKNSRDKKRKTVDYFSNVLGHLIYSFGSQNRRQ